MSIDRTVLATLLAVGGLIMAGPAMAQYPERPVTLIVAWAPGGGTDAVARTLAAGLERELGKPVNVVNRTGGSGVIGHGEIVNAKPDGYTIGLATAEINTYWWANMAPFTYEKLTPIALINFDAAAFHVAANSPWKDLKEAIAAIKAATPGTYKAAGTPVGAAYHLALSALLQESGIEPKAVVMVPTAGAAPGFQELAAGGVQIIPSSLAEGKTMVDAGRAKALAVFSTERNPTFPNIPTVKEAVGQPFAGGTWRGIIGPAGMSAAVSKRLGDAVEKIVKSKDFETFLVNRGFGVAWARGDDFTKFLAEDHRRNGVVMGALGLRQRP